MKEEINYRELAVALKTGIYKSMAAEGLISSEQLGRLVERLVCDERNG
ncbi:MAG: hypothetical protein K6A79_00105 [Ruminococcus sp.]|nr:hypothetical protein [Ruminococcus sp.]MCR5074196.1 hypothetical protein [Ruminococcus sp.]